MKLKIDAEGGKCPYQIEGQINGFPFYFRSRHAHWSMSILLEKGTKDYEEWNDDPIWYYVEQYGKDLKSEDAGWITKREARKFLKKACNLFKKSCAALTPPPE
jgi:hypothetical protein